MAPSALPTTAPDNRNRAFLVLLIGSIFWSLQPLMIDLSGSRRSPLLFNIIHRSLLALLLLVLIAVIQQRWLRTNVIGDLRLWRTIKSNLGVSKPPAPGLGRIRRQWDHRAFLFMTIGRFDLLLFAWAIDYLENTAVVAIVYSTSVLWFIFLRNREDPELPRRFSRRQKSLIAVTFLGLILVQASRTGVIAFDRSSLGIVIAGAAAFLNAVTLERSIAWGRHLKLDYFGVSPPSDRHERTKEVLCTLIGTGLAALIMAGAGLAGALITLAVPNNNFTFSLFSPLELLFVMIGSIVGAMNIISIRWSNLLTVHSEVNLIRYIESPLSLVLLFWLSSQQFERLDLYLVCTLVILTANYLIRSEKAWLGARRGGGARR